MAEIWGFGAAHGHGCTDVCCNHFKVLDEEEDFDINEVEEESVNEVVDVTIDSGAGRNVWPKGRPQGGPLGKLSCLWSDCIYLEVKGSTGEYIVGDGQ